MRRYVFAILFAQACYDYVSDPTNPVLPAEVREATERYFGSLPRSMLAMFMSIAGGVSWEAVVAELDLKHLLQRGSVTITLQAILFSCY